HAADRAIRDAPCELGRVERTPRGRVEVVGEGEHCVAHAPGAHVEVGQPLATVRCLELVDDPVDGAPGELEAAIEGIVEAHAARYAGSRSASSAAWSSASTALARLSLRAK